jgi:hypothetical protein
LIGNSLKWMLNYVKEIWQMNDNQPNIVEYAIYTLCN